METFDIQAALQALQTRESEAQTIRERILHDFSVEAAAREIGVMESEATSLHNQIDALREQKSTLTRKIGVLQTLIDLKRPPNPLGMATIGG